MGASSIARFDDDDEADWLADFAANPSLGLLEAAFSDVTTLGSDDYLELPQCGAAVVAAEIVAAMLGKPHSQLPEEVLEWVAEEGDTSTTDLAAMARQALHRVRTDSEAQELWGETAEAAAWSDGIKELERRLE